MLKELLLFQVYLTLNHASGVSPAIQPSLDDLTTSAELRGAPRRLENTFLKTQNAEHIHRDNIISRNTILHKLTPTLNEQDHSFAKLAQSSSLSHEAVYTSHPEHIHPHRRFHRGKRSLSLHEPSAALLRAPTKPHKPSKVPTQNFTLDVEGAHILLYYGKELVIDMTSPKKLALTSVDAVSYRESTISVISGIAEADQYSSIKKLVIYSGKGTTTRTPEKKGVTLRAASAQLFISGHTAFYSRSKHFNALLNRKLAEIIANRNKPKIPVEFRVFSGGKTLLTLNKTSIIILTDADFRKVADRQTLLYSGNTLHMQDGTQMGISEVFPALEHFMTLNATGRDERVITHKSTDTGILPGGGDLYVHKQTQTAFYSRDSIVNNKIAEFLMGLLPSLRNTVFSIRFETRPGGGPLDVVIAANGYDILRLEPHRVIDQSVSTWHYVAYTNSTVYVMDGQEILDAIDNVKEIRLHSDDKLRHYTTGTSEQIPGGGQLFTCQGQGLYSVDADLNDRIGDALLGAETHPPLPPSADIRGAETHTSTPSADGCGPKCRKETNPTLPPSSSIATDGCEQGSKEKCVQKTDPPLPPCKPAPKKMCDHLSTLKASK